MTTIEEVMAKLDPKTRKRVAIANEQHTVKQKTPSVGLNQALQGGLPWGRQVLIYGNKSAGKSSFCMQLIAEAQKNDKVAVWVDAEGTFEPEWAERLGVDTSKLLLSKSRAISKVDAEVIEYIKAGADMVIIDSITPLLPSAYFEKDGEELKPLEKSGQIGSISKDLSMALARWTSLNENVMIVLISQVRNKITPTYTSLAPTGGEAVKFYSNTIIKLWSSASEGQSIKGDYQIGDMIVQRSIGRKVDWLIENNKTGPSFVSGSYDFYYLGDFVGVDTYGDVLDQAEMLGLVQKKGAWYNYKDEQIQGRAKFVARLREDIDMFEELEAAVLNV